MEPGSRTILGVSPRVRARSRSHPAPRHPTAQRPPDGSWEHLRDPRQGPRLLFGGSFNRLEVLGIGASAVSFARIRRTDRVVARALWGPKRGGRRLDV